jgi:hypothetical protein
MTGSRLATGTWHLRHGTIFRVASRTMKNPSPMLTTPIAPFLKNG